VVLFVIGAAYFFGYSRKHLVAKTAAEEFAMLEAAEHELEDAAQATPSMATPKAAS
jgi:ethanolamine permease